MKRGNSQQDFASPEAAMAAHRIGKERKQQEFASPEAALAHYGVKGMRWGVRKQEETSTRLGVGERTSTGKVKLLDESKAPKPIVLSDKKQAKVDKFLERSDVMGTKIAELKVANEALEGTRNVGKRYTKFNNEQLIKDYERAQHRALRDAEAVKKGKLTSTQKKVIVGAAVAGVLVAGVAVTRGQQSGALNSYMLRSSALIRGQKVPFNVNKDLAKPMSAADLLEKVAKPVNPNYSSMGGHMNCRRSTYAYELRRRGFDVHATTSAVGWGQSESGVINALTPGSRNFYRQMSMSQGVATVGKSALARGDVRINPAKKIISSSTTTAKILEELAQQPNGSRGEVMFKFPNFGHSMAYEVVDGVPHIFDSQKGALHDLAKTVEGKWGNFSGAEITRLDNMDLDINFLTRWATNN